ncbi:MAG: Gfo/Idh/MocA family oxidoreductase [Verrucomicrobiota bacterium]
MASRTINVAVAGLGFMGATHLRVWRRLRNARLLAVCDPSRAPVNGVLAGVQGNLGNSTPVPLPQSVRVYREFDELAADPEIEVIDLCTPTLLHPEQVLAALEAGKHVLCEKPLARDAAEARRLLQRIRRAKPFLMPAMCMRFWPGWRELKQIVDEQTYGRVLAAAFRRVSAKPAWGRKGVHAGGALYDLHIHDTDFVNFLFGRPDRVMSTGLADSEGNIDHVVTQYVLPGGPVVHAEGSWLQAGDFNMAFTVHCERATIDFDLSRGAAPLRIARPGRKPRYPKIAGPDGYEREIRYFLDCVARGERPAAVTALDALTALEILRAEEISVRTGRIVSL